MTAEPRIIMICMKIYYLPWMQACNTITGSTQFDALKIGVPEISARKRKKALQYGTLIHKNLIKSKLLRE